MFPWLFNIFLHQWKGMLSVTLKDTLVEDVKVYLFMYADNTVSLAENPNALQWMLDSLYGATLSLKTNVIIIALFD